MHLPVINLALLVVNAPCAVLLTICAVKRRNESKLWALSAFLFAAALVVNVLPLLY